MDGRGGGARIGNRRSVCTTCNNWAQNVMRRTRAELVVRHPAEYEQIRLKVERDLYPQVVTAWLEANGGPVSDPGEGIDL